MDGTIELGVWRRAGSTGKVGKEEMAGGTTASVGKDKICSIGTDSEDHIAGVVANRSIGMRRQVIKKHITGLAGVLGGSGLTVGNFVQRDDDGGIATAGVIEEETRDLLHTFDTEFVEKRGNVRVRELNLLTVHGGGPAMWGMLRSGGRRMTQGEKRFGDVARHGDIDVSGRVVPVDLEAEITGTSPVFGEGILGCEGSKEMISIRLREEFNAEVINGESERGATIGVAPEARSVRDREVTVRGEVCSELIVRKNGSFLEAVHTLADFDVDKTLGVKVRIGEVVLGNDFGREITAVNAHVLENGHIRHEEKIFQVAGAIAGAKVSIGNDTVEMKLCVDETNGRRTNILVSIETVATDSHANAIGLGFARSHGADEVGVGDLATGRDLMGINEDHGVVAEDLVVTGAGLGEALGAASPFVGKRSGPEEGIRSAEERVNVLRLASGGIVHFSGNCGIVLDRLGERKTTMSARVKHEASEAAAGALPENGCGERKQFAGNGDGHPRK